MYTQKMFKAIKKLAIAHTKKCPQIKDNYFYELIIKILFCELIKLMQILSIKDILT